MPADIIGTNIIVEDAGGDASSASSPGRSSPTWCWPTRSTAPRPRRSRRCSRRCRSRRVTVATTSPPAAGAVLRPGDAEPDRDGGHLPAARGAARPLLLQAAASATRRREELNEILDRTTASDRADGRAGRRRRDADRDAASWCARCRSPRTCTDYAIRLVLATHPEHARAPPKVTNAVHPLRRQPARRPGARAGRQGPRAARGPLQRHARGRARGRLPGAAPPRSS